jgi:putative pyruvate formate lyase activating enzyme
VIDPVRLASALHWAEVRYASCDVCAEACGVNRLTGELGHCGLGEHGRVYKEYLHLGEERSLVPSHTIYLSGCNLRCVFCSDLSPVTRPQSHGVSLPPEALAQRIAKRRAEGARNVNFVGGLPDVNVLYILRTLSHCPEDTHVVWNTNLWTTEEAMERLTGVVSTWLVDLKFGDDRCALKLSGATNYLATLQRLLPAAQRSGALIVRHLLMPGHLECCTKPTLEWLARQLPDATVNIMTGYHPFQLAGHKGPLGGPLPETEREESVSLASALLGPRLLVDGELVSAS